MSYGNFIWHVTASLAENYGSASSSTSPSAMVTQHSAQNESDTAASSSSISLPLSLPPASLHNNYQQKSLWSKKRKVSAPPKTCKKANPICVAKNKKGDPCIYKATRTIYCTRHVSLALPSIIRIQRWWRSAVCILEFKRRGKAYEKRDICTNMEDFFTFTEVDQIPKKYFISYHEKLSNKIWGFDVRSLDSLFQARTMENPYTRMPLDQTFVNNVRYYIKKFKSDSDFVVKDDIITPLSEEEQVKKDCLGCFVDMGCLGYNVDHTWLCNLTRAKLIKLYYEFQDTVMYRSFLSRQQVQDMFGHHFPFNEVVLGIESKSQLELLSIICKKIKMILITNSANKDLGILLFLTALTNVSSEALSSLYFLNQNF
jgi:hypothetical protein